MSEPARPLPGVEVLVARTRKMPAALIEIAALAVHTAANTSLTALAWTERQLMESAPQEAPDRTTTPRSLVAAAPVGSGIDDKMRNLLTQAVEQTSTRGREALFHRMVDQLVPDEARIVGALSDGSTSTLVHVRARTWAGRAGSAVLENMSLVGKTANLSVPQQTPAYVRHLMDLDLVELGPEEPALKVEYEILAADPFVLAAIKRATRGPLPAVIERHTLRLSTLGRELWSVAAAGDLR